MIVFFGVKKKNHIYNAYTTMQCARCGKETEHYLAIQKRAFTVFFIPLIPLGTRKYLICRECKNAVRVKEFPPKEKVTIASQPTAQRKD